MTIDADPPRPTIDEVSAPFWAGLAQHRIVLQVCTNCGRRRAPRLPSCPYCGTPGGTDVEATGQGTVYSWVRAQRALSPAFAADVPYAIVTVDLDGGGRLLGRLVPAEAAEIGLRVGPDYFEHDDWTELRFRPEAV
jgi:uncharacterized OB-fold protein